jgi:sugar phosphate isomerase/epimerase
VDTVTSPPLPEGMGYDAAFSNVANAWKSCAQIAEDEGIKLVWEFEPGFMDTSPRRRSWSS